MSRQIPEYEFLVDWDGDGGLLLGEFESGTGGWEGHPEPPEPPEATPATVRSVSSAESASASFSVDAPDGLAENDVLVAFQSTNLGDASDLSTPTGGAAWVQLGDTISGGTDALHTKVWWKQAGSSEPTTYGFTQGSGADSVVAIAAFDSADAAVTPIIESFAPFDADTSIPTPGATPVNSNDHELRWVGAQYTTPPPETLTKTYNATWSASWYGFGKRSGSRLYQGDTQLGDGTGDQYGKIGFDDSQIATDLSGSTIDQVELRMSNEHSWYNSGLTARFGSHNNSSEPTGSSSTAGSFNRARFSWNKGQTKYVTLPSAIGEELRDGTTAGITTGRPNAGNRNDYGYFRGHNAGASQRPRLRITYTTAGSQPLSIDAPSVLTQQTNQSSNDFTGGALATRNLSSAEDTASRAFRAEHEYVRAHGLTVVVASLQPTPEPDESPDLAQSDARAYSGSGSLLVTWSDGSTQYTYRDIDDLITGRSYTYSAWVWVPSGGVAVRLAVDGVATGSASTTTEEWQQISLGFTATSESHTLQVEPAATTSGGEQVYLDAVQLTGPGEDITTRVLGGRTEVDIAYGRDHARSLSAIKPGETGMEVDNRSQDYSPDNPSSPLSGHLGPGRPVLIRATWQGIRYNLFWGTLDEYEITPDPEERSVQLGALDALGLLRDVRLSTELYPSVRTGEAIGIILDAIGWPEDRRDLDAGATTLRWWWAESDDAFDELTSVLEAEGPAAFAFVSPSGDFVFRDRHHRLMRENSLTVQATFRDVGTEPTFSSPVEYDIGWKDLVNDITVTVEERAPTHQTVVWEDEATFTIAAGETKVILAEADDPFLHAVVPVPGHRVTSPALERIYPHTHDMIVRSGRVEVTLSRRSGQSTEIRLSAVGGSSALIEGLQLRASPVTTARKVQVRAEDQPSIARYGRRSYDGDLGMAGVHDVAAIAELILGQRAERLPIMTITIVGAGSNERLAQILTRDLSDRVHITEGETFTAHDFYLEQIEHSIADIGYDHQVTFGLERVREQYSEVFTFDDDSRGFNDGVFGRSGVDVPSTVFVLDQSNLNEGLLGH